MKLKKVRISFFRNIVDSGEVDIHDDVTCLVGKNESGKTAFLHALLRLNPILSNYVFDIPSQYPAWLEKKDRLAGKNLDAEIPVSTIFSLDQDEINLLDEEFGVGIISSPHEITVSKNYSGNLLIEFSLNEKAFVTYLIDKFDWPYGTKTEARSSNNLKELKEYCEQLRSEPEKIDHSLVADLITQEIERIVGEATLKNIVRERIKNFLPKIFYFGKYSSLPYTVNIKKVLSEQDINLTEGEQTAKSLLKLAAAESDYIDNPNYESRIRELENVSNAITSDVKEYWTQNPDLRVKPDITQRTIRKDDGQHVVLDELKIRIWDDKHSLSLPFSEHSTGFQWFFSFLAAFSEFEYGTDNVILLLDEPALGLHAKAQSDILRFIDDRLVKNNQVIYTTHSPFMIPTGSFERIRLVEDNGTKSGAFVTSDVTSTDADTLFPLQGALGYDLVQNLFISPNNLVVEGTSDFIYIQSMSDYLDSLGRASLDPKWSIIPVGGADMIPTFVALLGNHLDVTVIVDGNRGNHQKLNNLVNVGIIKNKRIITISEIIRKGKGDIEDLFDPEDYLVLFNESMNEAVKKSDLVGKDNIIKEICRYLKLDKFNHGIPADYFLRNRGEILPNLTDITLDNFEKLIIAVNNTLSE